MTRRSMIDHYHTVRVQRAVLVTLVLLQTIVIGSFVVQELI
jgi:hypothetical protein